MSDVEERAVQYNVGRQDDRAFITSARDKARSDAAGQAADVAAAVSDVDDSMADPPTALNQ